VGIRIALYVIFVLCAAPIDSVLDAWAGLFTPDQRLLMRPLADGLIYLYAFVLAVEAIFRVEQHHELIVLSPWLRLPQFVSLIVIFFFIIDYMNVLRPHLLSGQSVWDSKWRQITFASFALAASICSFSLCEARKRSTLAGSKAVFNSSRRR